MRYIEGVCPRCKQFGKLYTHRHGFCEKCLTTVLPDSKYWHNWSDDCGTNSTAYCGKHLEILIAAIGPVAFEEAVEAWEAEEWNRYGCTKCRKVHLPGAVSA